MPLAAAAAGPPRGVSRAATGAQRSGEPAVAAHGEEAASAALLRLLGAAG